MTTFRIGRFVAAALAVAVGTNVVATIASPGPGRGDGTPPPLPGVAAAIDDPGAAAGLATTPDDRLPIAERRSFWAARVEARPDDFLALTQLALVEAEGARGTADLSAYERAAALIDRALAVVPAYPPTIRARGAIRFALHDFRGALEDAHRVVAVAPDDAAAIALDGDASLELGDLAAAEAAFERLAQVAPGPWLDIRFARLASVRGDHDRALTLARRANAAALDLDPADVAVYQAAVGEYARLAGDVDAARSGFSGALLGRPDDLAALVGLARIDLFTGDREAALLGLRRAAAIAPQPETLALLGDVLASSGDPADAGEAATLFETIRLIGRLGAIDGVVYDRAILRFELDHGGASAAVLAAAEASARARPDAAGHDLVAWAAYRLGRFDDAATAIDRARALGADDARLRYHAGAIALARGDRAGGMALLRAALALGPALDPIERADAEVLLGG